MWQFLKRSPVTSAIVGTVLLIALTAILYAIITRAGDDGFKRIDGKMLHWDRRDLPLVCFYPDGTPETLIEFYGVAAHTINDAVGETLLRPCSPWMLANKPMPKVPTQGLVYLQQGVGEVETESTTFEDENDPETGGRTLLYYDIRTGLLRSAIVQIGSNLQGKDAAVFLHELGHVLGLEHDRTKDSIMYENVSGRPGGLTQKDAKLLKGAYGSTIGN